MGGRVRRLNAHTKATGIQRSPGQEAAGRRDRQLGRRGLDQGPGHAAGSAGGLELGGPALPRFAWKNAGIDDGKWRLGSGGGLRLGGNLVVELVEDAVEQAFGEAEGDRNREGHWFMRIAPTDAQGGIQDSELDRQSCYQDTDPGAEGACYRAEKEGGPGGAVVGRRLFAVQGPAETAQ